MAIKGLTPQLAERGKIKIGEKGEMKTSNQGKQFAQPKKLDHFIITTVQRDQAGRLMLDTALMDRIKEAQGVQKLVEIPIRLLYDDIDLNFLTRYSCYVGNRCWCSGDGEQAERYNDQSKKYDPVGCPCERSDPLYPNRDKCKTLGTLQVLLEGVDRVGGVWKFRTTSWNTVNAVLSSLALIKTITGGPLAGIPLHMVLSPKTVTVPTTGQNMVIYVVSLEYRGPEQQLAELGYDIAKRRIEHQIRMDRVEEEARRLLVAPHQEPIQDQAETNAEFFPDTAAASEPQGEAPKDIPVITPAPDPEPKKAAGRQGQDPKGKGQQGTANPVTFPELMEMVHKDKMGHLPQPIKSHNPGAAILATVVAYGKSELTGRPELTMAFAPNLVELAQNLTAEIVVKNFKEAGIDIVILESDLATPRTERIGGMKVTLTPEEVEAAKLPPSTTTGNNNGGAKKPSGGRQSLF